jgi:hypothetical protein
MPQFCSAGTLQPLAFAASGSVLLGICALLVPATPAAAAPGCKSGFVLRLATPADPVCVSPASQARSASENARAPLLWAPGAFGPKTCAAGFVWRASSPDDLVCVTVAIRTLIAQENTEAPLHAGP